MWSGNQIPKCLFSWLAPPHNSAFSGRAWTGWLDFVWTELHVQPHPHPLPRGKKVGTAQVRPESPAVASYELTSCVCTLLPLSCPHSACCCLAPGLSCCDPFVLPWEPHMPCLLQTVGEECWLDLGLACLSLAVPTTSGRLGS